MLELLEQRTMKKIAQVALEKLRKHTWYLNQEYAPLSLFSSRVEGEEKSAIAEKLTQIEVPSQYSSGYPTPRRAPKIG